MQIPTSSTETLERLLAIQTCATPFRTGGWKTVIRDELLTHLHTNHYTGPLSLDSLAVEIIDELNKDGVTLSTAEARLAGLY